jgi:mono/diheme cytochrome c family protein
MFLGSAGFAQDKAKDDKDAKQPPPADYKIPPEDAKKPNPVKPDAASIADGKHLFSSQCVMCHGKDGDGKGDLAQDMQLKMPDYRDPAALKDRTDGELFYIITNGKGDMPSEGDRLAVNQRWNLINYIRSLASKEHAAAAKQDKPQSQ